MTSRKNWQFLIPSLICVTKCLIPPCDVTLASSYQIKGDQIFGHIFKNNPPLSQIVSQTVTFCVLDWRFQCVIILMKKGAYFSFLILSDKQKFTHSKAHPIISKYAPFRRIVEQCTCLSHHVQQRLVPVDIIRTACTVCWDKRDSIVMCWWCCSPSRSLLVGTEHQKSAEMTEWIQKLEQS